MPTFDDSKTLKSGFAIRPPFPFWTNRTLINGVISAVESLIGDAKLIYVIEGIMDDLKVWADANEISYSTWTNINTVPTAIKRATTYAVVAALYARRTKTFQSRVIPTVAPVTITVVGDEERAMNYWEDKKEEMLSLYLAAQGATRLWVSTQDAEPIFSMADIPTAPTDIIEWEEWLNMRRAG